MIDTLIGPMDPAQLGYIETRQYTPHGIVITKTYTHAGEVVKRDVHIELSQDLKEGAL